MSTIHLEIIMSETTQIEKQNLEAHVELCAQRYRTLEIRLTGIESKVSKLYDVIEESSSGMTRVLIATAGTVVAAVISTLVVILTRAH